MSHSFSYDDRTAVVRTTGGLVRGYVYDHLSVFKGIPYATARRFHAPQPAEPWEGVLDATSFGYVCPLLEMPKPEGELLIPHRYWIMDENCQNLNIWTPACDGAARPVMVWLHGGGYSAGSAIEHIAYEGENMSREGDVVVVSVNHRLNILGYLDLSPFGDEYADSANAGMDDIIAALIWIRDNIARFGGSPDNVTLFGQSGGGGKITTLLQMPAADGLFSKGINMSGVIGPVLSDSCGDGKALVRSIMNELGLTRVTDLEKVPYASLASAYRKLRPALEKEGAYVGCSPLPNAFYAGEPVSRGFRKESAQIPLMIGTVFGEFNSFTPAPVDVRSVTVGEERQAVRDILGEDTADRLLTLFEKAYPRRRPTDLLSLDFLFRLPAQEYIRARSAVNPRTYSYFFNQDMPVDGGRVPWHCADIPYFFHNTELAPYTQQEGVTEKLESEIFGAVMAFARSGDPSHPGIPRWIPCTPECEYTMIFDRDTRLVTNHDAELISLLAKEAGPVLLARLKEKEDKIQH